MNDVIVPATERLSDFPFALGYQQQVLQQTRAFYERMLQQAAGDQQLRCELAEIHDRLGYLAAEIGQDAEPAYGKRLSILADLVKLLKARTLPRRLERVTHLAGCLVCDRSAARRGPPAAADLVGYSAKISLVEFPSNDEYR